MCIVFNRIDMMLSVAGRSQKRPPETAEIPKSRDIMHGTNIRGLKIQIFPDRISYFSASIIIRGSFSVTIQSSQVVQLAIYT